MPVVSASAEAIQYLFDADAKGYPLMFSDSPIERLYMGSMTARPNSYLQAEAGRPGRPRAAVYPLLMASAPFFMAPPDLVSFL